MSEKSDAKEKGFVVIDRRGAQDQEEGPPAAAGGEPKTAAERSSDALPRIDFSTFVLSLSTSALYHMGLVEDPETGKPASPDLPLARQTIDTLEMMQEKTRGNLEGDEANLLESLLYELRMRFVEASRSHAS